MDSSNEYGMLEQHIALLHILSDFDNLCKKYGAVYSLGYGSLLGAMRHHGFIPWDDDIDVIMDRNNYKLLHDGLQSEQDQTYVIKSQTKETLWIPRFKSTIFFQKLSSQPNIDIFLIDRKPDRVIVARLKTFLCLFVQGMIKGKPAPKNVSIWIKTVSYIAWLTGKLFPLKMKFDIFDRVCSISNKKATKLCSCWSIEYKLVGLDYDGRLLDDIMLVDFETTQIPVTKHYEQFLQSVYGDWRTPPPINDRVPKHLI